MKIRLIVGGIILLAIICAAFYLRFGGVTHGRIYDAVTDESEEIKEKIDDRYRVLDEKLNRIEGKLNRIEGKLDRILEIAIRPLSDNMKPDQCYP